MIQQRLSFLKTTPGVNDSVMMSNNNDNHSNLMTSTEGQRVSNSTDEAGGVVDEKRKDLTDEKST